MKSLEANLQYSHLQFIIYYYKFLLVKCLEKETYFLVRCCVFGLVAWLQLHFKILCNVVFKISNTKSPNSF